MIRRRDFITLLGGAAAAWPLAGLAQEAGKVRRIGFLRVGEPPAAFIDGFRQGLREVGLVEGRDFVIEFAQPQNASQVPGAAAELVRRRVDILLASGTPSVLPARDAAGQIPVVFVATFDPVATGLVASLARPGSNITGMTSISGDVIAKRLQLVTELSEHHQRRTACRPRQARDRSRRLPKAALGQRCAAKLTAPECAAARQLLPASASVVIQLDQERKQLVRQILGRLILLAEHGADPLLNREVRRPHPRRRLRFRGIVTMMKAHESSPPPPPCVGITT